jgi:hypothetical protein
MLLYTIRWMYWSVLTTVSIISISIHSLTSLPVLLYSAKGRCPSPQSFVSSDLAIYFTLESKIAIELGLVCNKVCITCPAKIAWEKLDASLPWLIFI